MQLVLARALPSQRAEQSSLAGAKRRCVDVSGGHGRVHITPITGATDRDIQVAGMCFNVFVAFDSGYSQVAGSKPNAQVSKRRDLYSGVKIIMRSVLHAQVGRIR